MLTYAEGRRLMLTYAAAVCQVMCVDGRKRQLAEEAVNKFCAFMQMPKVSSASIRRDEIIKNI